METGLNHLHSFLRYIILALLLASIAFSFFGWRNKKPLDKSASKLYLFTLIFSHIQLLLGFIQYVFTSSVAKNAREQMPDAMSNSYLRYWAIEHLAGMLIAIALITIGRVLMKKKAEDTSKHKTIFIFYFIALIIIVATLINGGILLKF